MEKEVEKMEKGSVGRADKRRMGRSRTWRGDCERATGKQKMGKWPRGKGTLKCPEIRHKKRNSAKETPLLERCHIPTSAEGELS